MRQWWRAYFLLLRWQLLRQRKHIPFFLITQTVIAAGIVLGWSYLIPDIDPRSALYLTTGAMTMTLILIGMTIAPQSVAFQKMQGVFDYQRSLPVPRQATMLAHSSIWLAIAIPSMILVLAFAAMRFDLSYTTSPLVIPAVLLVAASAVAIGYGIAYTVKPTLVQGVANLVMLLGLLFAPVNYPAERLPDWAAAIHTWLPFQYMAQAIRETIDVPATGVSLTPFAILTAWATIGLAITSRVMTRRT